MVATMGDGVYHSDKHRLFNYHQEPSSGLTNNAPEIQRVPVINMIHTKSEQNDNDFVQTTIRTDMEKDKSLPPADMHFQISAKGNF